MPEEPIVIVKIEVPLEQNLTSATSINAQITQLANATTSTITYWAICAIKPPRSATSGSE